MALLTSLSWSSPEVFSIHKWINAFTFLNSLFSHSHRHDCTTFTFIIPQINLQNPIPNHAFYYVLLTKLWIKQKIATFLFSKDKHRVPKCEIFSVPQILFSTLLIYRTWTSWVLTSWFWETCFLLLSCRRDKAKPLKDRLNQKLFLFI